ncbi:TonB-dependent receptor, partial [Escherichia coli]|nr:TonB-dependent receptor [Escherichia coli]
NRLSILWSEGAMAAGSTDSRATFSNTRIEKQIRHRVQRNKIYTGTVGGENLIGEGKVEYSASYSESKQTYPRRDELLFRSSLRPTLSYDFANPDN